MLDYRKIRRLRRSKDLTQSEFALAVGYRSLCSVSRLERGLGSLSIDRLERIAQVLGVPVADLITPE